MSKKQIILIIILNFFVVLIGGSILRIHIQQKFASFNTLIETHLGTAINDTKKSNFSTLQSYLLHTITKAQQSVVSIMISKDIKWYVNDPAQLYGPGTIQQQTTKVGGGSGIIISKQGYIITNKHVVQDTTAKYSVMLSDGRMYNVDKIWFDPVLDLAVLSIVDTEGKSPPDLIPASFLSLHTPVQIGQFIYAIGNALSKYPQTVTFGILSNIAKKLMINNNFYIGLYHIDVQVQPGNSGGPIIDIHGNTLGITTAFQEGEGMSFALPLNKEFIHATLRSIETFGAIFRPIIGIQYKENTPILQKEKQLLVASGIYVNDVVTNLPAREAGLQQGDIIFSINDTPITHNLPFLYQLYMYIPGDTLTLGIIRGNKVLSLQVVLGGNMQ